MFKDLIFSAENSYGGNYSISDDGLTVTITRACNHCVFTNAPVGYNNIYFEITLKGIGNGSGAIGLGGLEVFNLSPGINPFIPGNCLYISPTTTMHNIIIIAEIYDKVSVNDISASAYSAINDVLSFAINKSSKTITCYRNGLFFLDYKYQNDFDIRNMYVFNTSTWNSISATNTFNFGATEFKYPDLANLYKNNQMLYVDKNSAVWGVKI